MVLQHPIDDVDDVKADDNESWSTTNFHPPLDNSSG